MKKIVLISMLALAFINVNAQNVPMTDETESIQQKLSSLQRVQGQMTQTIDSLINQTMEQANQISSLKLQVSQLTKQDREKTNQINSLETLNERTQMSLDSLQISYTKLAGIQKTDKEDLSAQIGKTNQDVLTNNHIISNRTQWGIVSLTLVLVIITIVFLFIRRRIKDGSNSIDEVRNAQSTLEKAQKSLLEESVKLDNKLIEVVEKQLSSTKTINHQNQTTTEADHSLALKIADEIIRIETNLSRMDSSVKGHKQLSKAVERIRNNFSANGYEIVDMLGKAYVQGMRAAVTFVTDETLEPGKQVISKIIKPQVNYKEEMIQAAQIEVSQSE